MKSKRIPTLPQDPERVRLEILDAASNGCERVDLTTNTVATPAVVEELLLQADEHGVELLVPDNTLADQVRDKSDEWDERREDPRRHTYTVVEPTTYHP